MSVKQPIKNLCVTFGQSGYVAIVASAQHEAKRLSVRPRPFKDHLITLSQSCVAQIQPAKAVVTVRIDPGVIDNQISGYRLRIEPMEQVVEGWQITTVSGPRSKPDVVVGQGFGKGVIVFAMQTGRKHARLIGKDFGGAVALVHVEIDDQGPPKLVCWIAQHDRQGNADIIHDAKPPSPSSVGMVRTSGKRAGEPRACSQRKPTSHQSSARCGKGAYSDAWILRQANLANLAFQQGTVNQPRDIVRVMGKPRLFRGDGLCRVQNCLLNPITRRDDILNRTIFPHGKAVVG